MYHAQLGRFCSRDPLGYRGSKWNLCEYVNGQPSDGGDPTGERKVCCKLGYESGNRRTWVRETECPDGKTANSCCSKLQGTFYKWNVVSAVDMPCRRKPNPTKSRAAATACCAGVIAIPSDPSDVIGTPVGCIVAIASGVTYVCCANQVVEYPFDTPDGNIVEKAKEIQAAIDRLRRMLNDSVNANRRNEIMEAIRRLEEQLKKLFE